MKKTKLNHAMTLVIASSVLYGIGTPSASADVSTYYNLTTAGGADNSTNTTNPTGGTGTSVGSGPWALWNGGTDGWANGANSIDGSAVGSVASQKWVGPAGVSTTPVFGYAGAHLNWGVEITGGNGGSGEISTFDSYTRYGVYADIDTAKGAWSATNTGAVFGGWRHDLDVGLFKSDTTGAVTLSVTGILFPNSNYGFTVFQGVDSVTDYNHHGQWNNNNNAFAPPYSSNSVFGGANAGTALNAGQIVAASVGAIASFGNSAQDINSITFNATAGQIYTIAIGGYRNGDWTTTVDGYKLTVSQVPVPAAVWLFGSALAGLGVFGRRNKQSANS